MGQAVTPDISMRAAACVWPCLRWPSLQSAYFHEQLMRQKRLRAWT